MICLRRQRSPPFQGEDISFVLMSLQMAHYIEDHQNITSCRKNPWEILQAFPYNALLHINQSLVRNKRQELGGEKSWKPFVFLQNVNRPLESEDQTCWIAHWRWSSLQVRLKMKNASTRKEISIKQVVALDLKTCPFFSPQAHVLYCTILFSALCKFAHLSLEDFVNLLKSSIYSHRIDWFKDIPEV